jgi:hypothetical protein
VIGASQETLYKQLITGRVSVQLAIAAVFQKPSPLCNQLDEAVPANNIPKQTGAG